MIRRFQAREARFSAKTLRMWAASGLPEALGVRAAIGDAPVEILLYDEIGWYGVTAKDFVLALAQAGDGPIHLRINSPGGDAFEGMAIYNALRARTSPVTVTVDGIAASAASVIAMAGKISMPEQAMLMIHNCWGFCCGNRNDMLEMAAVQEKIDGLMAEIYATKSGQTKDQMTAIMDAETWYTSTEAKAAGLCDTITQPAQQAALSGAKLMARAGVFARVLNAATLPPYDPDGDGDNDAEEALGYLNSIGALVDAARDCLTGTEDDDDDAATEDGMPMVPGASARRRQRAAATEAEWVCDADENLPVDTSATWDGPAAQERILDDAGFNGNSPDPAKAKRGFLTWDHHNPNLKGSYKLPFADVIGGELKAVKGGIDAAASRLPDTDIPADVKTKVRDVLDGYESRMKMNARAAARARQLRIAEAV